MMATEMTADTKQILKDEHNHMFELKRKMERGFKHEILEEVILHGWARDGEWTNSC
jgi:hypothetical protein